MCNYNYTKSIRRKKQTTTTLIVVVVEGARLSQFTSRSSVEAEAKPTVSPVFEKSSLSKFVHILLGSLTPINQNPPLSLPAFRPELLDKICKTKLFTSRCLDHLEQQRLASPKRFAHKHLNGERFTSSNLY